MVRPAAPVGSGSRGFIYGPSMKPVCIYIDGFNLYQALLKFNDNKVKWLDLRLLAESLISPRTEEIKRIYYFSAYADWWPDKMRRHQEYTSALRARGVIAERLGWVVPANANNTAGAAIRR